MKKIGVRELAALANVSIGTVDRALNGRKEVSEKTRQVILKIAAEHGYTPNLTARALSIGRPVIRIGVCIPEEIHYFYDQIREGIFTEAKRFDHVDIEILYKPVKGLDSSSTPAIRSLLKKDIRALILVPGNPAEAAPLIETAEQKKNIRVVCVATDDSLSLRSTSISVDPRLNGRMAGELMARFVPAGSRVAIVTGTMNAEDNSKKVVAFSKTFAAECPGGQVAQVIEGHEKEGETYRKCKALLGAEPSLAGIYVSTVNCLPVCRAVDDATRQASIRIVATDLFPEVGSWFNNGAIAASIYQDPYRQGQMAVRLIVENILKGRPFPHVEYLNAAIVLKANLTSFREMQNVRGKHARKRTSRGTRQQTNEELQRT